MMADEELVEKVARAIATASGADAIAIGPRGAARPLSDIRMVLFREQAAAAIAAVREADGDGSGE